MLEDKITAVITTSPLPSHPSTSVIDQSYGSIRFHLPDVPVVVLADGVHPNHQSFAENYETYLATLRSRQSDILRLVEFPEYTHQAGMIRQAFKDGLFETPLILWVEHDFILTPEKIEWAAIEQTLLTDHEADSIRFSDSNSTLAGGWQTSPFDLGLKTSRSGLKLIITREYMSFPNVARRELYEAIIPHMREGQVHLENVGRDFIEHTMDGNKFELTVYCPVPRQRCRHINGRGADGPNAMPKPPMSGL